MEPQNAEADAVEGRPALPATCTSRGAPGARYVCQECLERDGPSSTRLCSSCVFGHAIEDHLSSRVKSECLNCPCPRCDERRLSYRLGRDESSMAHVIGAMDDVAITCPCGAIFDVRGRVTGLVVPVKYDDAPERCSCGQEWLALLPLDPKRCRLVCRCGRERVPLFTNEPKKVDAKTWTPTYPIQSSYAIEGDESHGADRDEDSCVRCAVGILRRYSNRVLREYGETSPYFDCTGCDAIWDFPSWRLIDWDEESRALVCCAKMPCLGPWQGRVHQLLGRPWHFLRCAGCGAMHPGHERLLERRCRELKACVRCGSALVADATSRGTCLACCVTYYESSSVSHLASASRGCAHCWKTVPWYPALGFTRKDASLEKPPSWAFRICQSCLEPHAGDLDDMRTFGVTTRPEKCYRCEGPAIWTIESTRVGLKCIGKSAEACGVYARAAMIGRSAREDEEAEEARLRAEVAAMDTTPTCVVCLEAPRETTLLECGHVAACVACANRLALCPICRGPIVRVVRIYHA